MTLILNTDVNPGQAVWTNSNLLPGGVIVNDYRFSPSGLGTPITASTTAVQLFDTFATIPAGTLTPGTTLVLSFQISINVVNVGVDAYGYGFKIGNAGGIPGGPTSPLNANTTLNTLAPISGGFANAISPLPNIDFVAFSGTVDQDSVLNPWSAVFPNVTPDVDLPVRIAIAWTGASDPGCSASLRQYGITVIRSTT